jgi:hypothetical protein
VSVKLGLDYQKDDTTNQLKSNTWWRLVNLCWGFLVLFYKLIKTSIEPYLQYHNYALYC